MVRKGTETMKDCYDCKHYNMLTTDYPCRECKYKINSNSKIVGTDKYFELKTPEQPTIPPMPPVNTPKKEANRPLRIDVMVDVFGIEATKHFCLLNAFKCLWGAETEKSKEDVENAVWYLNEYIRLGGEDK